MRRFFTATLTAVALATSAASLACGACDEDKVAATYDHGVIDAATARHQQVVFVAVDGPVSAEALAARIAAAAARIRGVQKGTLRTSQSPPAFSFALNGTRNAQAAVADFRSVIRDASIRLTLIRIMRDSELIDPR